MSSVDVCFAVVLVPARWITFLCIRGRGADEVAQMSCCSLYLHNRLLSWYRSYGTPECLDDFLMLLVYVKSMLLKVTTGGVMEWNNFSISAMWWIGKLKLDYYCGTEAVLLISRAGYIACDETKSRAEEAHLFEQLRASTSGFLERAKLWSSAELLLFRRQLDAATTMWSTFARFLLAGPSWKACGRCCFIGSDL